VKLQTLGMFDFVVRSITAAIPAKQQRDLLEELVHAALSRRRRSSRTRPRARCC